MKKLNIAFCGNPEITIPCIKELLINDNVNLIGIITNIDKPAGRGKKLTSPPSAQYAKDNNIVLYQTENINKDDALIDELKSKDIDLFIVYAFSQFLSSKILNLPKIGCFNIHGSLLPKYRGAAPVQFALLNGDTTTGVCMQKMVKKMDAGDVILSREILIKDIDDALSLFEKLKAEAVLLVKDFIHAIYNNPEIEGTAQNEAEATYANLIKKDDGKIDFKKETSKNIINKMRAYSIWPNVSFKVSGKRIKLKKANLSNLNLNPEEIKIEKNTFSIGCLEGAIEIVEVQPDGKKPMTALNFLNGINDKNYYIG